MSTCMCLVKCQCGYQADLDEFLRSPSGVDLPSGHYQCRSCGFAWKVAPKGQARMTESGFVIPPESQIVEIPRTA